MTVCCNFLFYHEFECEFLNSDKSIATFNSLYEKRLEKMEQLSKYYFEEAKHGTDEKALMKWNAIVLDKLGISNLKNFGLVK